MRNAIQVIFIIVLFLFAMLNLVKIITGISSHWTAGNQANGKQGCVETMDAGQDAQGTVVHYRELNEWDWGCDFDGCDGIGI
jgi:hypothetical protein